MRPGDPTDGLESMRVVDRGLLHPRCARLALAHCPALNDNLRFCAYSGALSASAVIATVPAGFTPLD